MDSKFPEYAAGRRGAWIRWWEIWPNTRLASVQFNRGRHNYFWSQTQPPLCLQPTQLQLKRCCLHTPANGHTLNNMNCDNLQLLYKQGSNPSSWYTREVAGEGCDFLFQISSNKTQGKVIIHIVSFPCGLLLEIKNMSEVPFSPFLFEFKMLCVSLGAGQFYNISALHTHKVHFYTE